MKTPVVIATILRPEGETGVQTHFQAFAHWLRARHAAVSVVTPFDAPRYLVYPVFGLRRLVHLFNTPFSVWWYRHWHAWFLRSALRQRLKHSGPCVIYAQCPLSAQAALAARTSPEQRVVMVVHFNVSQADEWAGKGLIAEQGRGFVAIAAFEALWLPRLDGIIHVSDFMRRQLLLRIPAMSQVPSQIIPNFLSDPGEVPMRDDTRDHLICIGSLEPRKNQRYALHIIAITKSLGRPLRLTIVGDGPDRAELEWLANKLDIEVYVTFVGYVKQASVLLGQYQAYLHVAQIENCPFVLIEAMARGVPMFAVASGGVPETFDDGVEGQFIPLDNAEQAALLILGWFDSAGQLARAGLAARRRFLNRFEATHSARRLASFLDSPQVLEELPA